MAKRKKDPGTDPLSLGLRIKYYRIQRDLTQEALATKVGCTKSAVSQWEGGDIKNLKLARFFAVADALKVAPRYLATLQGPKTESEAMKLPGHVLDIAKRIADMPEERQKLLLGIFAGHVDDDHLGPEWKNPES